MVIKAIVGVLVPMAVLWICSFLGDFLGDIFSPALLAGFAGVGFLSIAAMLWIVAQDMVDPAPDKPKTEEKEKVDEDH
jgi:putative effector of murein hydrolase LrgA (UPF0299 family)